MIAGAAYYRYIRNQRDPLDMDVLPNWPLSEVPAPVPSRNNMPDFIRSWGNAIIRFKLKSPSEMAPISSGEFE